MLVHDTKYLTLGGEWHAARPISTPLRHHLQLQPVCIVLTGYVQPSQYAYERHLALAIDVRVGLGKKLGPFRRSETEAANHV